MARDLGIDLCVTSRSRIRCLGIAVAADGDKLPTEIRLFRLGENPTSKGTFIFDEESAKLVMADYEQHGVDIMFDLEHLSIDPEAVTGDGRNFDPDARAWARLEMREDGLYAVDIRWTPDGEARLREKRQRYVSPAFETDGDGRVVSIVNVALTALPATDETPALVAASRSRVRRSDWRKLSGGASFQDIQRSIQEALSNKHPAPPEEPYFCGPWIRDVFDSTVVYEFDGKLWECPYSYVKGATSLGTEFQVVQTYTPVEQSARSIPLRSIRPASLIASVLATARQRNANAS